MSTTKTPAHGTRTPSPAETWLLMASLVMDHRSTWRTVVAERTGMPFSRFRVLRRLEAGPLTATDLAERLAIDAAATSVILTDLVERGLVTKANDPADGRRKIISLTDAGLTVIDDVRAHAEAPPLLAALDDEQRTALHTLLTTLQEYDA